MIPRVVLASSTTPDGTPIVLSRESGHFMVRVGAVPLMSSAVHGSEEAMATEGCKGLDPLGAPRVLVGGLGMGFTLRAALDLLGPRADVHVVELLPCLLAWNRGPLAELSKHALDDRRVAVEVADVRAVLAKAHRAYDAILLDVDNGPEALTVPSNAGLYSARGLASLLAALRPGGVAVVWSSFQAPEFERRFRDAGFEVRAIPVHARGTVRKGSRHVLYVGTPLANTKPKLALPSKPGKSTRAGEPKTPEAPPPRGQGLSTGRSATARRPGSTRDGSSPSPSGRSDSRAGRPRRGRSASGGPHDR